MAKNLIRYMCKGVGKRFGGVPCEHYRPASGECVLLQQDGLARIFEQGRCRPFNMLQQTLAVQARGRHLFLPPERSIEALAREMTTRLTRQGQPQEHTLPALKSHLHKAAYLEVLALSQKKDIFPQGVCGDCRHLSPTKPYRCQRPTVWTEEEGEIENPHFGDARRLTKPSCKTGFEPFEGTEENSTETPAPRTAPDAERRSIVLFDMLSMLKHRMERAGNIAEKAHERRRYALLCKLAAILGRGVPRKEAVRVMTAALGCTAKTLDDELDLIREFFNREGVF